MRRIANWLGCAIFLLLTAIIGTEIGLRLYFDDPEYRGGGYMSISPNAFVNHEDIWLYRKNADIRTVAVYGFPEPKILPRNNFRIERNKFVEEFAEENGLVAHTLSAYRWYFQSDDRLLEDGFVELRCKTNFLKHEGSCTFEIVDIAEIDEIIHAS